MRSRRISSSCRARLPWLAASAVLVCGEALHAQSVKLAVDPPELTIEGQAMVVVTVTRGEGARPIFPKSDGFDLRYHGEQSQFSLVNGRMSGHVTYRWGLLPKAVGEWVVGPAEIVVDGTAFRSGSATVRVLPASSQPRTARPVFLVATVSDERPFVGEQVIYVWRFYRRVRVADPRLESLDLTGFLVEDLGDPQQGGVRPYSTTENGVEYEVSEIRKALFAQRPGTLTIPASRLQVQIVQSTRSGASPFDSRISSPFDEFFGQLRTQAQVLVTDPIVVEVRPLPPAPPHFSGLVGDFAVTSSVSSNSVAVGESLTQKITVSGTGNLHLMGDLPPDDLAGFKVYRDQAVPALDRSGSRLTGTKTWSRALVPLDAGPIAIPEVTLVYFDPSREAYATASAPAIALDVAPASGEEDPRLTEGLGAGGGKVAVRILSDDVLPIHRGLEAVDRPATGAAVPLLLAIPPLVYLSLLLLRRRADRHAGDAGIRRRRTALRRALRAAGDGSASLEAQVASSVLRRYVGDRVGAEGGALTARECAERLGGLGVSDAVVEEAGSFLARLDAAGYGGGPAGATVEGAELRALLERIDRELRRRR